MAAVVLSGGSGGMLGVVRNNIQGQIKPLPTAAHQTLLRGAV